MESTTRPYSVVLIVLACLATSASTARAETVMTMPLAKELMNHTNIGTLDEQQLERNVHQLVSRLLLDDENVGLDSAQELHHLVALGVQVQRLQTKGVTSARLRRAAMSTAFMMHVAGYAYDTMPWVKANIDGMVDRAPAESRAAFVTLRDSVRMMRAVGRTWFPEALQAVLKDDPSDATAHDQRGLWLLREGQAEEAATAFAKALAISPKPRFALNLYHALRKEGRDLEARSIRKELLDRAPALRGRLDVMDESLEDIEKTGAFDKLDDRTGDVEAAIEQVFRYHRIERSGAAKLLLAQLQADHPDDQRVLHAAAELWVLLRELDALSALLDKADKAGRLDQRLREARVAAEAHQAIQEAAAKGSAGDLSTLNADLDALAAAAGDRGVLIRHAVTVFVALAEWQAANKRGQQAPSEAVIKRVKAQVEAGLSALPESADMVRLALVSYLGIDQAMAGVKRIDRALGKLETAERVSIAFDLARIELGYGARQRDKRLLRSASKRLAKLEANKTMLDKAAWFYTHTMARVVPQLVDGATLFDDDERSARIQGLVKGLPGVGAAFDQTTSEGRLAAQALATTLGALWAAGDLRGAAIGALKAARQIAPETALAKLAAAQAALIGGDVLGAYEIGREGLDAKPNPQVGFALQKWLGYAANIGGDTQRGLQHLATMLDIWPLAGLPDVVEARSPRPLFMGDYNVGIELVPGKPLVPTMRLAPIVLLIPDVPHNKKEVTRLVSAPKAGK